MLIVIKKMALLTVSLMMVTCFLNFGTQKIEAAPTTLAPNLTATFDGTSLYESGYSGDLYAGYISAAGSFKSGVGFVLSSITGVSSATGDPIFSFPVAQVHSLIDNANTPPTMMGIGNQTVNEGSQLTFTVSAIDADGDTLTYSLVGAPTGASINSTTGVFTWTPTEAQGPGSYIFTVYVNDGMLTDAESIMVTVNEVNSAPMLQAIGNKTVNEESQLTFTASATDADLPANTLTYSLVGAPTGASINATTGVFTWIPTEAQGPGIYTFTVRVSDGMLLAEESITVTVNEVNSAPVLQAIGNQTVNEGNLLTFTASATDADLPANTLTYSLVGAPTGASINATAGVFIWIPTKAQGPGSYTFTVRVSDGMLTDEESITVMVNEVNSAPVLQAIGNKTVNENSQLTFRASATDADGDTLTYSLVGAPTGASINATTGVFTWTPSKAQGPGSYTIIVRVSDGLLTDEESITVTVNKVNSTPVLQAIGNKTVNEESQLTFKASATDADGDTLTYSLVGAPTGASINATTGVFTWTPSEAQGPGSYTFIVRVSDGRLTDEESIIVTVNEINNIPIYNNTDATSTTPIKLEPNKYKIIFNTNGGSAIGIQSLEKNKNIIKPENPKREGYLFEGWYKDPEFKVKWDFEKDVITVSTTLYAKWIENKKEIDESIEEDKPNFSDVSTHWSKEMIEEIAALGIINGYPDGTFRPNEPILRKHIAIMINRALDLKPIRENASFSDVLPTHPYYEEIQLLQQAGIVDGTNGQFKPDEFLTRVQLAKIIVIAFDFELGDESNFEDLSKNHWSYQYVAGLEKLGIVQGDNGKFNPQDSITRAQFVAILYRALNLTK